LVVEDSPPARVAGPRSTRTGGLTSACNRPDEDIRAETDCSPHAGPLTPLG
jgi:hypothetical protein